MRLSDKKILFFKNSLSLCFEAEKIRSEKEKDGSFVLLFLKIQKGEPFV